MQVNDTRPFVVDMDSHVMEPQDLWENYLEPQYRERAIRIRRRADGVEELIVDDKSRQEVFNRVGIDKTDGAQN